MPFGRWENFEACALDMKKVGHSEESANKICGAIQARIEKGFILKSVVNGLEILSKAEDELVIGGYATYELRDRENDIIPVDTQQKFLERLFKTPVEYQNISYQHLDFIAGKPLLEYTNKSGETFYSHVNEKGTFLLAKIRNDDLETTQLIRKQIKDGLLNMFSISGHPVAGSVDQVQASDGSILKYHKALEPWAVTLAYKGTAVNPKAEMSVISKQVTETISKNEVNTPTQTTQKADLAIEDILQKHGFNKCKSSE